MKLVDRIEMQQIDKATIDDFNIPSLILMENAGRSVAQWIDRRYETNTKIAVFSGSGNNGGDGFVIARHLNTLGYRPYIYILADKKTLKGDPLINFKSCVSLGIPCDFISSIDDYMGSLSGIKHSKIIVDAIFGTGLKGAVKGYKKQVIEELNTLGIIKLAVDVPSGLVCGEEEQGPDILKADATLAIGLIKKSMIDYPGASFCGDIEVIDIGFPDKLTKSPSLKTELIDRDWFLSKITKRKPDVHKGSMGRLAVIGGSRNLQGAPVLSALGGLYGGCGLTEVILPRSLDLTPSQFNPDLLSRSIMDDGEGSFNKLSINECLEALKPADALVIGPGIGRKEETADFIFSVLENINIPVVIDADAIFHLSDKQDILKRIKTDVIITPHFGEFCRLMGNNDKMKVKKNKQSYAGDFVKDTGNILVLKDAVTSVYIPDGRIYLINSGHPAMAKGGTGDVLSGFIGALLARGVSASTAGPLAAYIHGLAGSCISEESGSDGLTAAELAVKIPKIIEDLR